VVDRVIVEDEHPQGCSLRIYGQNLGDCSTRNSLLIWLGGMEASNQEVIRKHEELWCEIPWEAQMYSMYEASMPLVVSLGEQASIPYQVWLSGGRSPLRSSPLGSSPLSRGHKGEIAPLSSLDHYPLGQSPFVSRMELLRSEEREDSNDEHKEHKLNLTVSSNVTFLLQVREELPQRPLSLREHKQRAMMRRSGGPDSLSPNRAPSDHGDPYREEQTRGRRPSNNPQGRESASKRASSAGRAGRRERR